MVTASATTEQPTSGERPNRGVGWRHGRYGPAPDRSRDRVAGVALHTRLAARGPGAARAAPVGWACRWHCHPESAMPIYEYRCKRGHTFDVMQRMSDDPLTDCTVCGAPVQRVFHPVAVHFKGSGFYNTDYGKKSKGASSSTHGSKGDSKGDSSSSSDSGSSSKSDSSKSKSSTDSSSSKSSSSSDSASSRLF